MNLTSAIQARKLEALLQFLVDSLRVAETGPHPMSTPTFQFQWFREGSIPSIRLPQCSIYMDYAHRFQHILLIPAAMNWDDWSLVQGHGTRYRRLHSPRAFVIRLTDRFATAGGT